MTPATLSLFVVLALAWLTAVGGCGGEPPREPVLLVTGFGPFPGVPSNPSWAAVRTLDGTRVAGVRIRAACLDVAWDEAPSQLAAAVEETSPVAVLCFGVAPSASLRLETTARNEDRAGTQDVRGEGRAGTAIRPGGPDRLPTRLPLEALRTRLEDAGYEVETSDDAGGYLCNHVFYRLLDGIAPPGPAGFVHVPTLGGPWDLDRLTAAVGLVVEVVAETVEAGRASASAR